MAILFATKISIQHFNDKNDKNIVVEVRVGEDGTWHGIIVHRDY